MRSKWLEVAERQAGIITTAQLVAAGEGSASVRALARQGALERIERGIWAVAVGSATSPRLTELWIGLLRGGASAFAWRRSAAAVWGLDGCPWPDAPEVGVSGAHHPRRPGIPRLRSLGVGDLSVVEGIPVTAPARTLADLALVVDEFVMQRAIECVLRRRAASVAELISSTEGRRSSGARRLARMLEARPIGAPPTESDAETRFEILARIAGLPAPKRQFGVLLQGRRRRLDFAWPEVRLAVEVDGAAVHGPDALDADLRRQNAIVLDGWLLLRFTWWTVVNRSDRVRRDLRVAWEARSTLLLDR